MGLKRILCFTLIQTVYILRKIIEMFWIKLNWSEKFYCTVKTIEKKWWYFFSLFLEPKIENCQTIDEYGTIEEHRTFRGFTGSQVLLDWNRCFEKNEKK